MRRVADALDAITPARYGDVLRGVADLCDAALNAPTPAPSPQPPACAKCGGTDLSVRWHRTYRDCLNETYRDDWGDEGEHLHRACRTCGWSWATAVEPT